MEATQALEKTVSDADRVRLALAVSGIGGEGLPAGIEAAAQSLGLAVTDVVSLFADQEFLKLVRGLTDARASLAFHGSAVTRLIDIVQNGKEKNVLAAAKILGQITGDLKNNRSLEVKLTFDDLRRREPVAHDPLNSLFQIGDEVIDGELVDEAGGE